MDIGAKRLKLLVLPGDGIGPEITEATLHVLEAVVRELGIGLDVERHDIGLTSLAAEGSTLPQPVLDRVRDVDGVLLGPVSHYDYPPREQGGINPSAELRTVFELFSNVRPCRSRADLTILPRAPRHRHRAREHGRLLLRPEHVRRHRRVHDRRRHRAVGA